MNNVSFRIMMVAVVPTIWIRCWLLEMVNIEAEKSDYLHWTAGALSIKVNWNGNGEDNREQKLKGFISQLILFFCAKELDICASFILFVSKHHHGIRSPLTLSTYNVSSTSDYQQIMLMMPLIAVVFTEAFNFIIVSDSILYLAQLIW